MKNFIYSITLLTLTSAPLMQAAPHRGPKVQHELETHQDRIHQELIDQLIDFMLEKKVTQVPKRSGSGEMELIDGQALRAASYEEKATIIAHLPQEMREIIFNKLAEHLMRGPKKSSKGPFIVPSGTAHISQLDTFFLLSAILCNDSEGRYSSLRESIIDCLGENQILKLKTKLSKPHVQSLLPSDFKREFLTSDPIKLAQLVIRIQPLMEVK